MVRLMVLLKPVPQLLAGSLLGLLVEPLHHLVYSLEAF